MGGSGLEGGIEFGVGFLEVEVGGNVQGFGVVAVLDVQVEVVLAQVG